MNTQTLILYGFPVLTVLLVLLALYWQERRFERILERDKGQPWEVMGQWFKEISAEINHTSDRINRQLYTNNEAINTRLENTSQLLRLLNNDLGKVHEIGQQMRDFQHMFRTPKLRGTIGEQLLNDLLFQVLPKSNVRLQYRFKNGQTVDAVLVLDKGLVPIDAKFPMENFIKAEKAETTEQKKEHVHNFNRDVKKHIDSVSQKYILPSEGTLEFAVIYIPSEAVYHRILLQNDLLQHAHTKNILMCSPNSIYYFLKIILMGLEGQRLESTAQQILQNLYSLQHESMTIKNEFSTLLSHITHAKNTADRLDIKLEGFANRIKEMRTIGGERNDQD